jgi:carbon storage regulator CsrA
MLVLSRQRDESVVISKDGVPIGTVTVADIRGDKVRLGFTFPRELDVDREEIHLEKVAEAVRISGGATKP